MQFTILACNEAALLEKFEKLNKKCQKYSNELLSFIVVKTYIDKSDKREYSDVEVTGCVPKVEDCELISVISKLEDGTNIIANVPGKETPEEFRDNNFFCSHCNINRYRKEVVVIKNAEGVYKQLGKTCLKDYLGIDLENLVSRFSYLYELMESAKSEEFCERIEYTITPEDFLVSVAVCVKKFGYVSTKDWDGNSTKSVAWRIAFPFDRFTQQFIRENELYADDSDRQLAKDALQWVSTVKDTGDYWYNTKNIARQERISYKHIGYLAYVICAYQKHLGQEIQRKLDEANKVESNWLGQVKERLDVKATVIFTKELFSDLYGLKKLIKFVTNQGEILTWFASGSPDFEMGKEYLITATVKKHDEYQGVKNTIVSRVAITKEKKPKKSKKEKFNV